MTPPRLAQNFQYTDVASPKRLRQLESERVAGRWQTEEKGGGIIYAAHVALSHGILGKFPRRRNRRGRSCWKSCNISSSFFFPPSTCCAIVIYRQSLLRLYFQFIFSKGKNGESSILCDPSFNYFSFRINVSSRSFPINFIFEFKIVMELRVFT